MTERKIDKFGRILIPNCIFRKLNFSELQYVEITIEYGKLCIKDYENSALEQRPYVGIVRSIDTVHRVTIPREYLKILEMDLKTYCELSVEGEKIIISNKKI